MIGRMPPLFIFVAFVALGCSRDVNQESGQLVELLSDQTGVNRIVKLEDVKSNQRKQYCGMVLYGPARGSLFYADLRSGSVIVTLPEEAFANNEAWRNQVLPTMSAVERACKQAGLR